MKKNDGNVRLCVDFREELNRITPVKMYYLPSLTDIMEKVGKAGVLSKLDLVFRVSPDRDG